MSYFNKVAGTWQKSKPYTQVAGTWKYVDYVYNKVGGRWYTSFVKGGLVDKSWDEVVTEEDAVNKKIAEFMG